MMEEFAVYEKGYKIVFNYKAEESNLIELYSTIYKNNIVVRKTKKLK